MQPGSIRVSIVIPCYNSTEFLRETFASAAAQTLADKEIVLVDDGSTDATAALIAELAASAGPSLPVQVLSKPNGGLASARNFGIAAARGRYILPLDADDLVDPSMLARCAAILDGDDEVDIVYTDREDFGVIQHVWPPGTFDVAHLKYFGQIGYCSLYRRALWTLIGGYRVNVSGFDDWDFWLAAALTGCRTRYVPEPLFKHRRRAGSHMADVVGTYERLYARIIVNNPGAYSRAEITAAETFLATRKTSALFAFSRRLFTTRYLAGVAQRSP